MNDPVVELLTQIAHDWHLMQGSVLPPRDYEARSLRAHRLAAVRTLYPDVDELLRDLGGWDSSHTAWVFPKEDAS